MEIKTTYKIYDDETNLWHHNSINQGNVPFYWDSEKKVKDHLKVVLSGGGKINLDPYRIEFYRDKLKRMKIIEDIIIIRDNSETKTVNEYCYNINSNLQLIRDGVTHITL